MTCSVTEANAALDRLIAEFGDRSPVGDIIKAFAQSVQSLSLNGVAAGLVVAAEAMTRDQLAARGTVAAGR